MGIESLPFLNPKSCLFLFLFLVLLLHYFVLKLRQKSSNLPPGSFGYPILGETLEFLQSAMDGNPENFMIKRTLKYKSQIFKTSILGQNVAVLTSPSGNKFLYSQENNLVQIWWPPSMTKLLGSCIITTTGDLGKIMRKQLFSFLSPEKFSTRQYIRTINLVTRKHVETHWNDDHEVRVFPSVKLHLFELACRLFMSLEDDVEIEKLFDQFNVFLKGAISIPFDFPGTQFYKARSAMNGIKSYIRTMIRKRAVGQQKCDMVSHLLTCPDESGKFMPESTIVNNVVAMLFAGHDTMASAITIVIKYLAEHPDVYQKVLKEQNDIGSSKSLEDYLLEWEDIQKMKYSWSVVCEGMRLFPPSMGGFREAISDISYQGYHIPKGWKLYWSASLTHKDPDLYPNHLDFDESRFERGNGSIPYSYVPFGGGPRMCLGKEFARLEILILLHYVVTRYRWELVVPNEKIQYDPTPMPAHGLPIFVHAHGV